MTYITKAYLKDWLAAAFIRAVKTAAQTAVALIGTNAVGVTDVDWLAVGGAALLAAIVSMLTSTAGIPEVDNGTDVLGLYSKGEGAHARKDE